MNNTNKNMLKEIQNRYGHLLDKYINATSHPDPKFHKETREYIRDVENGRYGNLLDNVSNPLQKMQDSAIRFQEMAVERRKRKKEEENYAEMKAKEHIQVEKAREQIRRDRLDSFADGLIQRKKSKIEAEEAQKARERREAQREQDYLGSYRWADADKS